MSLSTLARRFKSLSNYYAQSRTSLSPWNPRFNDPRIVLYTFHRSIISRRHASSSTGAANSTSNKNSNSTFVAFTLGSLFSGSLVYYLASRTQPSPGTTPAIPNTKSGFNEQYGTTEDFQRAIEELRSTFPTEHAVSTDLDDLRVHGFSENDYHPGVSSFLAPITRIQQLNSYVRISLRRISATQSF